MESAACNRRSCTTSTGTAASATCSALVATTHAVAATATGATSVPNANTTDSPVTTAPSAAAGGVAIEDALMVKLREYDLEHIASNLVEKGFFSVKRMVRIQPSHVATLGLSAGDEIEFEEMRQALQEAEQKRLKEEASLVCLCVCVCVCIHVNVMCFGVLSHTP